MTTPMRPLRFAPATLAVAIAFYSLAAGCGGNAESPPANGSATQTPPAATPSDPPAAAAPDTAAPASIGDPVAAGRAIFIQRCALCHGPEGRGDGPGSKGLKPAPRNYHDREYMNSKTDDELLATIRNGKGAMPAWGKVMSEEQMRAALAYVRQLGKKD